MRPVTAPAGRPASAGALEHPRGPVEAPGAASAGQGGAPADLEVARHAFDAMADRLFGGPLPLADALAALRVAARGSPLSRDELSGRAALAAFAAGRRVGEARPPARPRRPSFDPPPDIARRIERGRRYLGRVPGAIAGQGGHAATFRVALAMVRGFDLPEDVAYGVIAEWNQRCEPPWSERELRHKIADAARSNVEAGYLLRRGAA